MSDQKNRRILVVDDNAAIHDDFSKVIGPSRGDGDAIGRAAAALFGETAPTAAESQGYELVSAFQGQEALARVEESLAAGSPYAMAFVDVRMPPGWDGVETVRRIWEIDPELQVVICTAYSDYSWNDMVRVLGQTDRLLILKKPFDNVEVRQMASALTKKWQLACDARRTTEELQRLVDERTDSLSKANRQLTAEVSERKQMEAELAKRDEQLRQSHKLEAVGSLAGGISHEFNNLLQVIRGYAQYAMQGLSPEDQRHQDLEQVVAAADRAATLTRQLLGFSRRQVLERTNFDHREVVDDLVKLLRPLIGEHIELAVDLSNHAGSIHGDRGLVQQMLLNLCINSRDSMSAGGRLTLSSERAELSERYCAFHPDLKPGSYIVFSVADTGCGMSPDVKERIFEPFFTTKGVGKGTGLGLAMVYGGVQQHEGMISVYSEVGHGTTFRIYLPTADNVDSANIPASDAAPKGGHETILVAEDESMVRDLAVRILTGAGYSVLVAADGAEAVERFGANADAISLVILDAIMPKLTGHQAYDRIKLINPDLPAIFCSGYDPKTGQIKALMEKGCRLVQKPYNPDVLLTVVREVLDQHHRLEAPLCSA